MRLKDPPLLTGAVVASGFVAVAGHLNQISELVWIFQPLAMLVIVLVAWQRGRLADHYAQFVTLGLGLATLAAILGIPDGQFAAVSGAAAAASLCYLRAFTAETPLRLFSWPMLLAALAALAVGWWLWPTLDNDLRVLMGAALVIGAMMAGQAIERARALRGWSDGADTHRNQAAKGASLAALGAVLTCASALVMGIGEFVRPVPLAIVWGLALFWAGQAMVALSVPERRQSHAGVG